MKVQLITLTKWLKKLSSGYKSFDDQTSSGRPETLNSKAVLKARFNMESVRGAWQLSPVWFIFMTLAKASGESAELGLELLKYCKTFDSPKYIGNEQNKMKKEANQWSILIVFYLQWDHSLYIYRLTGERKKIFNKKWLNNRKRWEGRG